MSVGSILNIVHKLNKIIHVYNIMRALGGQNIFLFNQFINLVMKLHKKNISFITYQKLDPFTIKDITISLKGI
jgi:hypothetical protein